VPYSVANYPASLNPATGGCRNITGHLDSDETATIYAVTSTISANGDTGADPNKLVKVTDLISANALPAVQKNEDENNQLGHFVTIRSAKAGEVFRGVAFAPKDHGAADNQE